MGIWLLSDTVISRVLPLTSTDAIMATAGAAPAPRAGAWSNYAGSEAYNRTTLVQHIM